MPGSLSVRDVSKSFAAVQVLDHVSLVVAPGDRIGIVGPNGIAKSTLLPVLAACLLGRFDVFRPDERTNNLDFAGLERLERFLGGLAAPVVLVSHDRAFLDRTVKRVVEIEAETRRVHEYTGTWSEYEAARERARAQHEAAYADYLDEKQRYSTLLATRRQEAHLLGGERKLARQTGGSDRRATNAL